MSVTARQAVDHYRRNQSAATEALGWYQELRIHCQQALAQVQAQGAEARLELARAYLPALDAAAIARCEQLTGFRGLSRRNPLAAMDRERAVLESSIARIRADERYEKRELLAGPDGTLVTKLAQNREMLAPWSDECKKYEELDGFMELFYIGYDTPSFAQSWWHATYWKHWADGDRICRELGVDDFGDDVLPVYRKACEQRDFWRAEAGKLESELQAVHDLVQQHDQAVARLPQLPALYLEQSQALLAEYLVEADYGLLEEWLEQAGDADRAALSGLRKCAGLKMKEVYLDELEKQGLGKVIADLDGRARRYANKVGKYIRPKYAWSQIPESQLDNKFGAKYSKLQQQRAKLRKLIDRISLYDSYDRFDLANEPDLWWYELTGGRPPRLVPRVRSWYERNPNARPVLDDRDRRERERQAANAVATAAAARELDDVGYLS